MPLEQGKFIGIDLPRDAKDVQIANPAIANVIMRTARQVTILGMGNGQTNIAFYDADHRQIEALDISVVGYPIPAIPTGPAHVVIIYRGPENAQGARGEVDSTGQWQFLSCTHTNNLREGAACYNREEPAGNLKDLPKGSSVTMPAGGK